MVSTRSSRRRFRWWWLLAIPLLLAGAGYVSFPYLLDSALLKGAISSAKLSVDWDSLRMVRFGQFGVSGLRIQADSRSMQWRVALDQAMVDVNLRALFERRFETRSVEGSGLEFQLRRKPTAEKPADATHLPPMPGLELTERQPRSARRRAPGWQFAIGGVEVTGLRQVWVDEYRLDGDGSVRGAIATQIRGPFSLDDLEVRFTSASLLEEGELVASALEADTRLDLEPSLPAELRTVDALRKLDGKVRLRAETGALGFLSPFFQRAGVELSGTGSRLDVDLAIDSGELLPGSRFDVTSEQVRATFPVIGVEGSGEVRGVVDETGLAVTADVPRLDLVRDGDAIGEAVGFVMTLRSENRDLAELLGGGSDAAADETADERSVPQAVDGAAPAESVDAPSRRERVREAVARAADAGLVLDVALEDGTIEDLRPFADLFPSSHAFRFTGGAAHLRANAGLRLENGAARIHLEGDDVGLVLMDRPLRADVEIELDTDSQDPRSRWFDIREGKLSLTSVRWDGKGGEGDWWARLTLRRGRVRLTKPIELVTDVQLAMRDTRPFVQMLADEHKQVGWFDRMLTIKDVQGGARLQIDQRTLRLRDVAIDGKGMMLRAQMDLQKPPDALMLIGLHGLRAGFALDAGKRDLKIRKPGEWYEERVTHWTPIAP